MSPSLASAWWPLAVMVVDWVAVAANWKRLEYVAKPAAMLALLVWLAVQPASAPAIAWFALGIVFSLAGDVLLLLSERWFIAGLVAFLLAHVAYIVGLNARGPVLAELWLVFPVAFVGGWLYWRIAAALKAGGRGALRLPVAIYTAVISLMVVSALACLFRLDTPFIPALLVSVGALLFFVSDALLAWNRFVAPLPAGKLIVIVAYHLGQMALIAGAALMAPPVIHL